MVTAHARGHAALRAASRRHKHYGFTSLLPFGDNNCSAVSSSCTGRRTIGGATVSMLASIPSFVSIAEKRRSMRSCASEATNGHRALASHFHLVRNVRVRKMHTHAHVCACMWDGRASRLMSRSKTVASASSCVGAEPLLLVDFLAGSAASPAEVLLLQLREWHLCE